MPTKTLVKDLKPASYNPRKITDHRLEMLKKSMVKFGDLSAIVFNVKTGNLVSGHQRIKHLDPSWPIEKHPHKDKTGTVAVGTIDTPFGLWSYREVSWSEKWEAAANIAANNHGGEFDTPKLKEIILEIDDGSIDIDLTGFNRHEIENMMTSAAFGDGNKEEITLDDVQEDNPKLQGFIDRRERGRERGKDKSEVNFWVCLVFQSYDQKHEFLSQLPDDVSVKYGMYVDGETLVQALGYDLTPNKQKPHDSRLDNNLTERVLSNE